mmetsp:Transcript_38650/g.77519  ORF Transcript_38650/g.77519 Transcript_38650/m.77519 type:complete len:339 (+) Transcript_38650:286-1302(+)
MGWRPNPRRHDRGRHLAVHCGVLGAQLVHGGEGGMVDVSKCVCSRNDAAVRGAHRRRLRPRVGRRDLPRAPERRRAGARAVGRGRRGRVRAETRAEAGQALRLPLATPSLVVAADAGGERELADDVVLVVGAAGGREIGEAVVLGGADVEGAGAVDLFGHLRDRVHVAAGAEHHVELALPLCLEDLCELRLLALQLRQPLVLARDPLLHHVVAPLQLLQLLPLLLVLFPQRRRRRLLVLKPMQQLFLLALDRVHRLAQLVRDVLLLHLHAQLKRLELAGKLLLLLLHLNHFGLFLLEAALHFLLVLQNLFHLFLQPVGNVLLLLFQLILDLHFLCQDL